MAVGGMSITGIVIGFIIGMVGLVSLGTTEPSDGHDVPAVCWARQRRRADHAGPS